ncbi:hypothetical protein AA12717_0928 [Gluconacetobacter sacchari DSM 12717]|uniref:Uncharacterized protein n=2 Tax=Gluconacetobacter sacchari TaxID=92759 RepID=A0A7W4NPD3_9PROT|nr:hypothetical protein [Gluconacetobacter sacchari]MBB2161564.1 hypothetical protein [Gluconacetobacter sacchari]GBQ21568.1 hypothetical protein AA12717_0928 [Gluconacetobacter sacchari DSM 12717]
MTCSHSIAVSKLLAFLRSHDCTLSAVPVGNDEIEVRCMLYSACGGGSIETTRIPATWTAARNWLGY